MKLVVLFCVVVAAGAESPAYGAPQEPVQYGQPSIKLVSQRFDIDDQGNYEYGYEQDNGQKVEEVGKTTHSYDAETGSISKDGSFEYVSPEGEHIRVDYIADEGGFQPSGAHLPVAPPQLPEYAQHQAEFPELYEPHPQPTYV